MASESTRQLQAQMNSIVTEVTQDRRRLAEIRAQLRQLQTEEHQLLEGIVEKKQKLQNIINDLTDAEKPVSPLPDIERPASTPADAEDPASLSPNIERPASPPADAENPTSLSSNTERPASPPADAENPASPSPSIESVTPPPNTGPAPFPPAAEPVLPEGIQSAIIPLEKLTVQINSWSNVDLKLIACDSITQKTLCSHTIPLGKTPAITSGDPGTSKDKDENSSDSESLSDETSKDEGRLVINTPESPDEDDVEELPKKKKGPSRTTTTKKSPLKTTPTAKRGKRIATKELTEEEKLERKRAISRLSSAKYRLRKKQEKNTVTGPTTEKRKMTAPTKELQEKTKKVRPSTSTSSCSKTVQKLCFQCASCPEGCDIVLENDETITCHGPCKQPAHVQCTSGSLYPYMCPRCRPPLPRKHM